MMNLSNCFYSRMEDPDEEWRIQEYNNRGKASWILNKGLGLGKKILVTGVLISSAPLVLPPLVIVSAIGFAVSVPSGIVLASYACAEKLMSKLLPRPSPLLLEYVSANGDEEEICWGEGEDAGLGENIDILMMEEEEQREDIKRGIESRIELPGKEYIEIEEWNAKKEEDNHAREIVEMNEQENIEDVVKTVLEKNNDENEGGKAGDDIGEKDVKMKEREYIGGIDQVEVVDKERNEQEEKGTEGESYGQGGFRRKNAQEEDIGDIDVINAEENGYEEDDGEYLEDHLEVINGVQIEGDREEYKEETLLHGRGNEEPIKVHGVAFDLSEGDEENEGATIEVTTVVMEENGDQARQNNIEEEDIEKETTGLLERIRDEGKADDPAEKEKHDVEKTLGFEENGDQRITTKVEDKIVDGDVGMGKSTGITKGERAQRKIKEVLKESQEMQDMEYKKDVNDVTGYVTVGEEQTPVVNSSSTLQAGKAEDNVDNANSSKKKEIVALTNANTREIGDQNIANGKYSSAVYDTPMGKSSYHRSSLSLGVLLHFTVPLYSSLILVWTNCFALYDATADSLDHAASLRKGESKEAGISSSREAHMPSNEVRDYFLFLI